MPRSVPELTVMGMRDLFVGQPPKLPSDNIRLIFSCMICNTLDKTTIRMNYIYGEGELNCFACGHRWVTKITLGITQVQVYAQWQNLMRDIMGPVRVVGARRPRRHGAVFCERCGVVHAGGPTGGAHLIVTGDEPVDDGGWL